MLCPQDGSDGKWFLLTFIQNNQMLLIILYLVIGFLGSFTVAFIGSGGSLIILSGLTFIFLCIFPHDPALKIAIGTGISTFPVICIAVLISQFKQGYRGSLRYILMLLPCILIGAFIGPHITMHLPSSILHPVIGVLLGLFALYKIFFRKQEEREQTSIAPVNLKVAFITISVGFLSAVISTASGIAIGVFMLPCLGSYMPYRQAISTNIWIAFPSAVIGMLTYAFFSGGMAIDDRWHLGYIYLPALFCIIIATILGVVAGGMLTTKVSTDWIKKLFYIYIFIAGAMIGFS